MTFTYAHCDTMTVLRVLNLLLVAAPLLGVCHGEPFKNRPQAFVPRSSRGAEQDSRVDKNGHDTGDSKSSPLDEFDDIINSFDERYPEDDDVFDMDESESGQQDDYEEFLEDDIYSRDANDEYSHGNDDRMDELHSSTVGKKGSLYDAYNQLHTLAQVRHVKPL